jgi:hypothetical protein
MANLNIDSEHYTAFLGDDERSRVDDLFNHSFPELALFDLSQMEGVIIQNVSELVSEDQIGRIPKEISENLHPHMEATTTPLNLGSADSDGKIILSASYISPQCSDTGEDWRTHVEQLIFGCGSIDTTAYSIVSLSDCVQLPQTSASTSAITDILSNDPSEIQVRFLDFTSV